MTEILGEKRFAIYTLGCKVNQEESAAIANVFEEKGWRQVSFGEPAEVTVLNTCTVTQVAEKKSRNMLRRAVSGWAATSRRNMLRRAVAANPDTYLAVTGCYVQMKTDEAAAIDGVDLLIGANEKDCLYELAAAGAAAKQAGGTEQRRQVMPAREVVEYREIGNLNSGTERTRAFVKIEDGCNQFCTYCIVPYVRGPVRSRSKAAILAEIRALAAEGYGEVVLTGIHTGAYGTDRGEEHAFADLVAEAAGTPNLRRLRFGSVEPHEITPRLIEMVAGSDVICPHFHIPLQAATDDVLLAMGRSYDMAYYFDLVERIRAAIPRAAITTDIIAGFPGETNELFEEGLANIERLRFADAHIFPYSRRPGTPAAELSGQVLNVEKNRRAAEIAKVVTLSRRAYRSGVIGEEIEFLVEREVERGGVRGVSGYTADYLPVFASGCGAAPGQMVRAKAVALNDGDEVVVK